MDKIWLKSYPPHIPAEINPDEYTSIPDLLNKSIQQFSELPAFSNMGVTLSYTQLDKYAQQFAAYLQTQLQLQKGERIALMMPNILQYPIALFGALRAGLVIVNVNPLYTERELEHQLRDSGAETIVVLANFADTLEKVIAKTKIKHVILTEIGDVMPFLKCLVINFTLKYIKRMVPTFNLPQAISFKKTLSEGKNMPFNSIMLTGEDTAFLQYTGGTTGVAKGAILSHRNIIANLQQVRAWVSTTLVQKQEVVITALPLYHIFSLTINCLTFMNLGAHNVLITNPRDIQSFVKEISKVPFSVITGVNTLFNALLNNAQFRALEFSSLKISLGGGAAIQKSVADKWQEITANPMLQAYGLTECSPAVSADPLDAKTYTGTIGLPIPSTEAIILNDEGNVLPTNEIGELAIKGPQVMQGYWQRPEETEKTFKNGWLLTGDIATMDQHGFIRIVDRKKDMILVSGFNVYPNEIEEVVGACEGVLEVAAIGIPHDVSGEVVKIFVVKKDANLTEDKIMKHCREQLTGYKLPRRIVFVDSLPKSNIGKILRKELKNLK